MVTEVLVEKALAGEADAVTALIAAFIPVIRSRIRDGCPNGLETDDLLQEGMIGLVHALDRFDPCAGVKFTTFATTCIDNQIVSALRRAGRKKHAILNESGPFSRDDADSECLEEKFEVHEMACELQVAIETKLTPLERRILFCYLDGLSYDEISAQLSISRKSVDNGMHRVRRKLKS